MSPNFIRAPLLWGLAFVALYAPLAFVEPVLAPPPPGCTDWLWCDHTYAGLAFNARPAMEHLYALIAIPNAFLSFLAARVAGARRGHWFMAGPVLALLGACAYAVSPFSVAHFFVDASASYRPAVWVASLQFGLMLGMLSGLPAALATLAGSLVWRFARVRGGR